MDFFVKATDNCQFCLDRRVRLVVIERHVFWFEGFERSDFVANGDCRKRQWLTRKLLLGLLKVLFVNMHVAKRMNKLSRRVAGDLCQYLN